MGQVKYLLLFSIFCSLVLLTNCGKDSNDPAFAILGCMDPISVNYNSLATKDNESCKYAGCTDPLSVSYDSKATDDDGTCMYFIVGEWDISFYFSYRICFRGQICLWYFWTVHILLPIWKLMKNNVFEASQSAAHRHAPARELASPPSPHRQICEPLMTLGRISWILVFCVFKMLTHH